MSWRLVDSGVCDPAFTVAADEAMAMARAEGRVPDTLHFYIRSCPTVSLGYFQKAGEAVDLEFCARNGIRVLRRVTGGSAVYTDRSHLIYGLAACPESLPGGRGGAFRKVCSALVFGLEEMGIDAKYRPANDITVGGRKISGSAQMRRWGIILQHGTLIMSGDPAMMTGALRMDAAKVAGRGLKPSTYTVSLAELAGSVPQPEAVKKAVLSGFRRAFGTEFRESEFTGWEKERIKKLVETKYGLDSWNFRF